MSIRNFINLPQLICLLLCYSVGSVFAQETEDDRKYIFKDNFYLGVASGYMGPPATNGKSISVLESLSENPFEGNSCFKVSYDASEPWAGLFFQNSAQWRVNVKDKNLFANLSGYDYYVLHARADKNVNVKIGFGEGGEEVAFVETISLTPEWQKFSFKISDIDMSSLNGIFMVTFENPTPTSVYFDEIYLEKKQKVVKDRRFKISSIKDAPQKQASGVPVKKITKPENFVRKPIKVEVKEENGKFTLYRGGEPYYIRGAGGQVYMDRVAAYGGNSIRTWSWENAEEILDEAYNNGLTVMLGFWIQHERHGYDYNDDAKNKAQIESFRDVILRFKDHPALLCWGIGNEVDLFYTNHKVWNVVQAVAKMVHELDPNHPTSTVTAGLNPDNVKLIVEKCPDIDIYGVNTYGDLETTVDNINKAGWKKAYIITEWGPNGHWEVQKTSFKTPIEQTSTEKAASYRARYKKMKSDTNQCIGSYVFLWGSKQETTATWYGLFLEDGTETSVMDEIYYGWTGGRYPANRAPRVDGLLINGKSVFDNIYLLPNRSFEVVADVTDPDGDRITYKWEITPESTDIKAGGDAEATPESLTWLITKQIGNTMTFKTPKDKGPYRLFVYAYDGRGKVATANTMFYVK